MSNNKIAIIGDRDSILAFSAVGVAVYPVKNEFDTADTLRRLAREYSVILITEDLAKQVPDLIARYKTRPYPIVLPIPRANGTDGFGMAGISKNVEKAIGSDILSNK